MEFWFPEHAKSILQSVYALALIGLTFSIVGALWFFRRYSMHRNLRQLPASSGFVFCLGGMMMCASIAISIGGPEPAPPVERLTSIPANLLFVLSLVAYSAGMVLERAEKRRIEQVRKDNERYLASLQDKQSP